MSAQRRNTRVERRALTSTWMNWKLPPDVRRAFMETSAVLDFISHARLYSTGIVRRTLYVRSESCQCVMFVCAVCTTAGLMNEGDLMRLPTTTATVKQPSGRLLNGHVGDNRRTQNMSTQRKFNQRHTNKCRFEAHRINRLHNSC